MITASIVTYHTPIDELARLVDCIFRSVVDILYIVDNASEESVRNYAAQYDKIKYIPSKNKGYGHGHNIAIRLAMEANAKYHVVMNPDIYWNDTVVETLSQFMDVHKDCGLVMPKVLYPNGDLQYLCKLLPTPLDSFGRRFMPVRVHQERHNAQYEMRDTGYNKVMEVPALSGCFMFLRVDVLREVGIFDERYFMYAEDVDLCRRIGEVSTTMFNPEVSIYHEYEKGSYKSKKLLRYHVCSMIKYFNKWGWFFDTGRRQRNKNCTTES